MLKLFLNCTILKRVPFLCLVASDKYLTSDRYWPNKSQIKYVSIQLLYKDGINLKAN